VRVRQPGVHREQRHLDGEGEQEREEQPALLGDAEAEASVDDGVADDDVVERAGERLQGEDADEHDEPAGERVEEELHRGRASVRPAPDADDQVHRHEGELEQHVEQQQVGRGEHADDGRLEHEERGGVADEAVLHAVPRGDEDQRHEEGGEQDQREADAVDGEGDARTDRGDPRGGLGELQVIVAEVEAGREPHRRDERRERDDEPDGTHVALLRARCEREQARPDERQEDGEGDRAHQPATQTAASRRSASPATMTAT
jgi:hypothetical protein